jgi:hypothetical protein
MNVTHSNGGHRRPDRIMDIIVEYALEMVDISGAILEHRQPLTDVQVEHVEIIHQRGIEFIVTFQEKMGLPVRDLRRYLSHDALSPLTVVVGFTQLILFEARTEPLPEAYMEAFDAIRDYGQALVEEVKTLHEQLWGFMQTMGIPR